MAEEICCSLCVHRARKCGSGEERARGEFASATHDEWSHKAEECEVDSLGGGEGMPRARSELRAHLDNHCVDGN